MNTELLQKLKRGVLLHSAAEKNDVPLIQLLMKYGSNPHYKDNGGITALGATRTLSAFAAILDSPYYRVNVDELNKPLYSNTGNYALHTSACQKGEDGLVRAKRLLEAGVSPNVQNKLGDTPLHLAARKNNIALITLLMEYDADPHIKNSVGATALGTTRTADSFVAMVDSPRYRINVSALNEPLYLDSGNYVLHAIPCQKGEVGFARTQRLLEAGVNPNVQNKSGDTPLHLAARKYNVALIKLLMEHGANPHIQNSKGVTALEECSTNAAMETLLDMLSKQWFMRALG